MGVVLSWASWRQAVVAAVAVDTVLNFPGWHLGPLARQHRLSLFRCQQRGHLDLQPPTQQRLSHPAAHSSVPSYAEYPARLSAAHLSALFIIQYTVGLLLTLAGYVGNE